MTPAEVRLIDEAIRNKVAEFESDLRSAYADSSAYLDKDQYLLKRDGSAIKMSREEKISHLISSIAMWGDE